MFSREQLALNCNSSYHCNKCNGKRHISSCTFDDSKSDKQNSANDDSTLTDFSENKNSVLLQIAYIDDIKNPNHWKGSDVYLRFELVAILLVANLREKTSFSNDSNRDFKNKNFITAEGICYSAIYSELSNQDVFCVIENYEHLNVYP